MAAPLERPKTPLSVVVVGVALAALIGLVLLRWVIGMVITLTKIGIAIAIVVAFITIISRLTDRSGEPQRQN